MEKELVDALSLYIAGHKIDLVEKLLLETREIEFLKKLGYYDDNIEDEP